jgi:hypothetical protein
LNTVTLYVALSRGRSQPAIIRGSFFVEMGVACICHMYIEHSNRGFVEPLEPPGYAHAKYGVTVLAVKWPALKMVIL